MVVVWSVLWGCVKKKILHMVSTWRRPDTCLRETRFPVSLHLSLSHFQSLLVICHFIPARLQLVLKYFPHSQLTRLKVRLKFFLTRRNHNVEELHFYFYAWEWSNHGPHYISTMVQMSSTKKVKKKKQLVCLKIHINHCSASKNPHRYKSHFLKCPLDSFFFHLAK